MEPTNQKTSPAVPIAIICGFAMIAVAIFFTNQGGNTTPTSATSVNSSGEVDESLSDGTARVVDETDYILGNPNAPIVMIEYSDYDCPFCKEYHRTMHQIMDEYGITGRVAWVYRQFPLAQLHPNSPRISEAALCVGDIGGNDAFWAFSDRVFESRDITEPTNVTKLLQFAQEAGISSDDYVTCMEDGRMKSAVEDSIRDGFDAGARGTPYTILMVGNQQAVINGAQPYATVKGLIDNLINQLDGNFDTGTVDVSEIETNMNGVPILN